MKLFNKKKPGINRKRNLIVAMTIVVAILIFSGVALSSSGEEHGPKGWAATDTYKVVNFTVLIVALFFLLRKPVARVLNARIKGIQDNLNELGAKKKEAEKKLAEYNERLFLLSKEADEIIAGYIRQGNEAKARILEEAESEAEKLEEHARRNIENEFKQAKSKLQEEMFEKALIKAEEIIKNKINSEDQDRLVDEYLEKVEA